MSKQAEEIARRALEVWNSENWVEEAAKLDAADIVVVAPAGWPESGTSEGQEAWHRQIKRLKEVWTEESYTALAIESRGPAALVHGRWRAYGEASGIQMDMESWVIYVSRGEKLARVEFFLDEAEARARYDELAAADAQP